MVTVDEDICGDEVEDGDEEDDDDDEIMIKVKLVAEVYRNGKKTTDFKSKTLRQIIRNRTQQIEEEIYEKRRKIIKEDKLEE